MGYFKDSDDEERVQGWSYSKRNICAKCLDDPHLRSVVKANAEHQKCDFCGRKGKKKRERYANHRSGRVYGVSE
jgi:hypothetical protein